MNTLQFDMLKRMVNLEKKLNRAMKIDIAATNASKQRKPELLSPGSKNSKNNNNNFSKFNIKK